MSDVSYKDLCNLIANEINFGHASPTSVDRYLQAIYRVVLRQLELNHKVTFQGFGTFELREHKSGERLINDPVTREQKIVYIKPRYSIFFKPSSIFDVSVNENDFKRISDKKKKRIPKRRKMSTTADLLNKSKERGKKK